MHMSVDETGGQICALCIDLLLAGKRTDAQDDTIADRDVTLDDLFRKNIDDLRVFDDQSGVSACCIQNCSA